MPYPNLSHTEHTSSWEDENLSIKDKNKLNIEIRVASVFKEHLTQKQTVFPCDFQNVYCQIQFKLIKVDPIVIAFRLNHL